MICVEDNTGKSRCVFYAFVRGETNPLLNEMIGAFCSMMGDVTKTVISMTDKCSAEINAFKDHMPQAKNLLCLFHVIRAFRKFIYNLKKFELESKHRLYWLCVKLVKAELKEDFDILLDKINGCSPLLFQNYLKSNWLNITDCWALYLRKKLCTGQNNTNNKCEGEFSRLKKLIEPNSSIATAIKVLTNHSKVQELEVQSQNCLDSMTTVVFKNDNPQCNELYTFFTDFGVETMIQEHNNVSAFDVHLIDEEKNTYFSHNPDGSFVDISKGDRFLCDCEFFCKYNMPCVHLVAVMSKYSIPFSQFISSSTSYLKKTNIPTIEIQNNASKSLVKNSSITYKKIPSANMRSHESEVLLDRLKTHLKGCGGKQYSQMSLALNLILDSLDGQKTSFLSENCSETMFRLSTSIDTIGNTTCPHGVTQPISCEGNQGALTQNDLFQADSCPSHSKKPCVLDVHASNSNSVDQSSVLYSPVDMRSNCTSFSPAIAPIVDPEYFTPVFEGLSCSPAHIVPPNEVNLTSIFCDKDRLKTFEKVLNSFSICNTYEDLSKEAMSAVPLIQSFDIESSDVTVSSAKCELDGYANSVMPKCVAEHMRAVSIEPDGNCIFRSICMGFSGNDKWHEELRVRVTIELIRNKIYFLHPETLFENGHYTNPKITAKLFFNLLVTGSFVEGVQPIYDDDESNEFPKCLNVQDLFKCDVLESARSQKFVGMWHIFAAANVLECNIKTYGAPTNPYLEMISTATITPFSVDSDKTIQMLWTGQGSQIMYNHGVALLSLGISPPLNHNNIREEKKEEKTTSSEERKCGCGSGFKMEVQGPWCVECETKKCCVCRTGLKMGIEGPWCVQCDPSIVVGGSVTLRNPSKRGKKRKIEIPDTVQKHQILGLHCIDQLNLRFTKSKTCGRPQRFKTSKKKYKFRKKVNHNQISKNIICYQCHRQEVFEDTIPYSWTPCKECNRWFHSKCINNIDPYVCPMCQNHFSNPLL